MAGSREMRAELERQDEADVRARRAAVVDGPPDGAADRVWLEHAGALEAARRPGGPVGLPAKLAILVVALVTALGAIWATAIGHGTTFGLFAMFGGPILLVLFLAAAATVQLFRDGW